MRKPMSAQRLGVFVGASLLAACASTSPPSDGTPPPSETHGPAPSAGRVLGSSDRLLIYQPALGDTLRSIAARFLGSESRDWVIGDFNAVAQAEPNRPLIVPLKPINPSGVSADQYQTVPILCYHRFGNTGGKMAMSAGTFAAQLDWLARNDYRVIPLNQLPGYLEGRRALPKRSVVITIDDGYESVHRIALEFLKHSRRFHFFALRRVGAGLANTAATTAATAFDGVPNTEWATSSKIV